MVMAKETLLPPPGTTQKLSRDAWIPALAAFTIENRGAHAELEVLSDEIGRFVELENRPFDGIAADVKDNEVGVWIMFGTTAENHFTHGIQKASEIWVRAATASEGAAVEVESEDGTRTLLELTKPEDYA